MMTLRDYQHAAVYDHLRTRDDNPCVVIPTAGGKTPVIATICKDAVIQWNGRVLVLAHVKELGEQMKVLKDELLTELARIQGAARQSSARMLEVLEEDDN